MPDAARRRPSSLELACAGAFGVSLALSVVVGDAVDLTARVPFRSLGAVDVAVLVALMLLLSAAALVAGRALDRCAGPPVPGRVSRRWWLGGAATMLVCWTPTFLQLFPGVVTSDSLSQLGAALGLTPWSNHHPVAHTVLIGLCGLLARACGGSFTATVAVYSVIQALLLATSLGYVAAWSRRVHRLAPAAVVGWAALNPVVALMAVAMWKDVLWSAFALVLAALLWDGVEDLPRLRSRGYLLAVGVAALLVGLFRTNGKAVLALVLLAAVLLLGRRAVRLAATLAGALAVALLVTGPVYDALGILRPAAAEGYGIPLQQVAYVLRDDGEVAPEDAAVLGRVLPLDRWERVYLPGNADQIKQDPAFDRAYLAGHRAEFQRAYLHVCADNADRCAAAWATATAGYWHVGTPSLWLHRPGVPRDPVWPVEAHNLVTGARGPAASRPLLDAYARAGDLPLVDLLVSAALPTWLLALSASTQLRRRRADRLLALAPLAGAVATLLLAAPIAAGFRYIFTVYLAVPVLLASLLCAGAAPPDQPEPVEEDARA